MGFQQTVVRYESQTKTGRPKVARHVVRHSNRSIKEGVIFGKPCIVFEDQERGDRHIVEKSLVVEIFIEEEDPKYGTMTRVRDIEI